MLTIETDGLQGKRPVDRSRRYGPIEKDIPTGAAHEEGSGEKISMPIAVSEPIGMDGSQENGIVV